MEEKDAKNDALKEIPQEDLIKLASLSREELVRELLKERLERLELKKTSRPRQVPEKQINWATWLQTCPHCHEGGTALEKFGLVVNAAGVESAYSWCKKCRSIAAAESNRKKKKEKNPQKTGTGPWRTKGPRR